MCPHCLYAVPGDRVSSSQLVQDLSKAVAKATGKPEAVRGLCPSSLEGSGEGFLARFAQAPAPSPCQFDLCGRFGALYNFIPAHTCARNRSLSPSLQYVMISLTTDKPMSYGGTEEPCAYGELISIGAIGGDKNKKASIVRKLRLAFIGLAVPWASATLPCT